MTLVTRHPVTGLRRGPVRYPDGRPPVPSGCRWCGIEEFIHWSRSSAGVGRHLWTPPTPTQILARMRARRRARIEARRLAAVEVAFSRAADLVGPSERRRRARAAGQMTPTPAPATPDRCDAMTHNSVGQERFCEIEDPLHLDDHDDGDGHTWPIEGWER
jgi:hypothetical protein